MSKSPTSSTVVLAYSLLLCLFGSSCQPAAQMPEPAESVSPPIRVFHLQAAASTQDALNELLEIYKADHELAITVNYASSAALAQQIVLGAPADLFLSASSEWVDQLEREKLVVKRQDLVGNRLVVIVPRDSQLNLTSLADLKSASVQHLALADPASVPVGKYAKQALEKSGNWDAVSERVVRGSDVRQTLTFVEQGEAEAGIVYATDATASSAVRIVYKIPSDFTEPIVYPLALLTSDNESASAQKLFDFLCSSRAAEVFAKHGFEPIQKR